MKGLFTAAGLAALGVSTLQGAAPVVITDATKPWSISASLRGFYDDNYTTSPSNLKRDSIGFSFNPRGTLNWVGEVSKVQLSYSLGVLYFEDRSEDPFDINHQLDAWLQHEFSERYKIELSDSFVVAQEPEILDQGTVAVPLRTEGDNIRNTASIDFFAQLTELWGLVAGYSNTFYDYEQDGLASRSALLDRMQHLFTLNMRAQLMPETIGVVGYQYGIVNYTSDEDIFPGIPADIRDNTSHYLYVGADHHFTPTLTGSARIGAQLTDYGNVGENEVSPYIDVSLSHTYGEFRTIQFGIRHSRNATDVGVIGASGVATLDQESTTLYAVVDHRINARLNANLLAQYQHSTFHGGDVDGDKDSFFLAGLNFSYKLNEFWSAEAGYNFDKLSSDIDFRSFTRNRIYLGLRLTY